MKRYGNLYGKMFSIDRLYEAYAVAAKGKRKRADVQIFEADLGANIVRLHREIKNGSYAVTNYKEFVIHEPKERVIYAPAFRDIVVQHDIYRDIYPIFNASFIDQSYACRIGYGTHKAASQAWEFLKQTAGSFYLKMDIRKFFYSINRRILRGLFERKIKEKLLVDMMMQFAEFRGDGIPIGNLLSQLYALVYLDPLDHFMKRTLKCRRYVRYADDFVVFGLTDRGECLGLLDEIKRYIAQTLDLRLSKWSIKRGRQGINFVGYRMWPNLCLIRKCSLHKFNRALRKGKTDVIVSLMGHAKKTNTLAYMLNRLRYEYPHVLNKLPKQYKQLALEV